MTIRALLPAALPALLLHGVVLGGLPSLGSLPAAAEAAPMPVRVRSVAATAPVPPLAPVSTPAPAPVLTPAAAPSPSTQRRPAEAVLPAADPVLAEQPSPGASVVAEAETAPPPAVEDIVLPAEADPPAAALPEPGLEDSVLLASAANPRQAASDDAGGLVQVDGDMIPIYATSFPPSQTLRYNLQRGLVSGTGELSWRRDPPGQPGAAYELQLLARISSLTILTQISKGGFDKAGIAPLRFTDQRLRGSVRAANFQRQRNLITFSGPAVEYPMVRGVQDRLSWMMQVPAILSANPRLAAAGQQITLYVVGARGDASVWDFSFEARERIKTETGEVSAVKFSRQPRKPYDTLAEVWLDPARHFLPLRARIGNPDDGAMLELTRID